MHVPAATGVAVEPATVHTAGVPDVNDTGSPELADPDRMTGSPTFVSFGWANVIVCGFCPAGFTLKDCGTGPVGAQSALPSWEAVMVQVPAFTVVAVDSDTVHICGVLEVNETCSFEVAVADKTTCASTCVSGGWAKVIVCLSFTVNLRGTWRAGA